MGQLGKHLLLGLLHGRLLCAGCLKFLTHYVEALGKRTENISLIHLKRRIKIAARNPYGKVLELIERIDDAALEIDIVKDMFPRKISEQKNIPTKLKRLLLSQIYSLGDAEAAEPLPVFAAAAERIGEI